MSSLSTHFSLRTLATRLVARPLAYRVLDGALGRLFGGYVLAYHDLPAARFVEQIEALRPARPVPLGEIVARVREGKSTRGLFAITFDDGVGETVRAIATAAEARGWPVTFYLPTAYLDAEDLGGEGCGLPFQRWQRMEPFLPPCVLDLPSGPLDLSTAARRKRFSDGMYQALYARREETFVPLLEELRAVLLEERLATAEALRPPAALTWAEVERLSRNPLLRFESHGVSHQAVSALTPDEVEGELLQSRDRIREHTGRACRHFCYPYGTEASIGPAAVRLVAEHFDSGVTMQRGRLGRHAPALLPRIPLYPWDTGATARLKTLQVARRRPVFS